MSLEQEAGVQLTQSSVSSKLTYPKLLNNKITYKSMVPYRIKTHKQASAIQNQAHAIKIAARQCFLQNSHVHGEGERVLTSCIVRKECRKQTRHMALRSLFDFQF